MLAPVTHHLPLATIRRKRLLPLPGSVLVRAGQSVTATEVVATASLSPEHLILDVARGLNVKPGEATKYIQRQIGEEVTEGAIIARRGGLSGRELRAPTNGRIVSINNGRVLLQIDNRPFELRAGMSGTIVSVEADRGVIIENTGTWIQGVWGNGPINYGQLHILANEPDHQLTSGELDISKRGTMMFAGHCNSRQALELAQEVPLRGLILGSLATHLLSLAMEMTYPIIVIEGFGNIPVNSTAHTLLTTNEGREVTINAEARNLFSGQRPEIIIPLPTTGQPPSPMSVDQFTRGQIVRFVRSPHAGKVGTISAMLVGPIKFPSGVRAPAAEIEFEGGEKVAVPLANIEVLG